jgi:DNA-binding NtrC family response regulator
MKKKILICDDEMCVRESLKLILSDIYDIIIAENSMQAIELIDHYPGLGCVLLDIKMPGLNGLECLRYIRNKHNRIPVIVVTGYQCVETAAESIKTGATYYVTKPFKADTILETVEQALSSATSPIVP